MKTIEAIAALEALGALAQTGKALPLKFAYAAARNRRKLSELAQVYEQGRMGLVEKFGEHGDDGQLKIENGNVPITDVVGFSQALGELQQVDLEDVNLHLVALDDFPKDIGLAEMDALMVMVREGGV